MKVTGQQLKQAIELRSMRVDHLTNQFEASIMKFEGEDKKSPTQVGEELQQEFTAIAKLKEAQSSFNLKVSVEVGGKTATLAELVRSVGQADIYASLWRRASEQAVTGQNTRVRDTEKVYAEINVDAQEALKQATQARQFSNQIRDAIAKGNRQEQEIEIDPQLLEISG